jgi:Amt family ammonium transporter
MNTGDTAWLLASSALVLLMTPALALFYGGLVRRKNVLSTIMHSMAAIPVISIVWALLGYSLAFGPSKGGFIGDLKYFALEGLANSDNGSIPALVFVAFQMMFAIITPALISGAFAERLKFSSYLVFIAAWSLLVYVPVCHWVWNSDGWLLKLGALDFAGGTVVHMTSGFSALVFALVLGKRASYPHEAPIPHNLTMTVLGAGLLWFGWFGFNAGSALGSGQIAATAFMATHLGAAGGAFAWLMIEWAHNSKPTALGVASGLVAGLVAITPAAGFVAPWAAIVIGLLAGAVCYGAVVLKGRLGYDDSLDAFGIHGVGGLLGALLTGVFASSAINPAGSGAIDGNVDLIGKQLIAVGITAVYAMGVTFVLLMILKATIGLRVHVHEESEGLDISQHGEEGYQL